MGRAAVSFYVAFWCGDRKRHLAEVGDDGRIVFTGDGGRAVAVEADQPAMVVQAVLDVADPDRIVVTRRELSFMDD